MKPLMQMKMYRYIMNCYVNNVMLCKDQDNQFVYFGTQSIIIRFPKDECLLSFNGFANSMEIKLHKLFSNEIKQIIKVCSMVKIDGKKYFRIKGVENRLVLAEFIKLFPRIPDITFGVTKDGRNLMALYKRTPIAIMTLSAIVSHEIPVSDEVVTQ